MPESVSPKKYWAFISYSSKDRKWAQWLHSRLENYPIPKEFQGTTVFDGAPLGKNLRPIFRDRDELTGSAELGPAIQRALEQSRYLIVLCSPNSAKSVWVNKEIESFKLLGGEKNILALIVDGEPNASSSQVVDSALECFPPELRYPAEPLAGDLRKEGDGKARGFLKVLAGIAQLDFDMLYRRHERLQRRRRVVLAFVSMAMILSLSALALLAWMQKQRAETSERDATLQRDQARHNLARIYREKAGSSDAGSAESLAWTVEAAKTDASLLSQQSFQGQISSWMGPFSGPDQCVATGIRPRRSASLISTEYHLSRVHQRLFVQNTNQAWKLLGWTGAGPMASGVHEEPIRHFVSSVGETWFAMVGYGKVEVRSWQDGKLIARTMLADRALVNAVSTIGDCLFLTTSDGARQTKASQVWSWNPLEEKSPKLVEDHLEGEVTSIAGYSDGKRTIWLGGLRLDDKRELVYRSQKEEGAPWRKVELEHKREIASYFSRRAVATPPGVLVLTTGSPSNLVIDTLNEKSYLLGMTEGEHVLGVKRQSDSSLTAFIGESQKDGVVCREMDVETGVRRALPNERVLTYPVMDAATGSLYGWDAAGRSLGMWRQDKPWEWRDIILPKGLSLNPLSIIPLNGPRVLIHGYTFPENYSVLVTVNLDVEGEGGIHLARVADFEALLSEGNATDKMASLKILSHKAAVISEYIKMESLAELTLRQVEKKFSSEGVPLHLNVDNEGAVSMLRLREKAGLSEIQWDKAVGDAPWFSHKDISKDDHRITSLDGYALVGGYSQSTLLAPDGKQWPMPKSESLENLFSLHRSSSGNATLFRQDYDGTPQDWVELASGKKLWASANPADTSPNALVDMSAERYLRAFPNRKGTSILTLSSRLDSVDEKGELLVREFPVSGTDPVRKWSLKADAAMVRALKGYGTTFELFDFPSPVVVMDATSSGGDSHDYVVFECQGDALVERLRGTRAAQIPTYALPEGRGLLVDTSDVHLTRFEVGWLSFTPQGTQISSIPLPNRLVSMIPDPTGKRCLFALDEWIILWDLTEMRQIGQFLTMPDGTRGEQRVSSIEKPFWDPSGKLFYLRGSWAIHQFDGMKGGFIRRLPEHDSSRARENESTPDLMAAALSPDGSWLASADAYGRVVVSRTKVTPSTFEELQKFSRQAGGVEVDQRGDVIPWSP